MEVACAVHAVVGGEHVFWGLDVVIRGRSGRFGGGADVECSAAATSCR